MLACVTWTLTAVALLLWAEHRGWSNVAMGCKPLASVGFVALAWIAGASSTAYGRWLGVGLVLCLVGDVLLIGKNRRPFLAGLVAFLLGHVAYVVAFVVHGVDVPWAVGGGVAVAVAGVPILRWLWPHVSGSMRAPVAAYVAVISVMVAVAIGATGAGATPLILAGALGFYASDLFVARQRFVVADSLNRQLGLPLYYGAQLLLAATAAT